MAHVDTSTRMMLSNLEEFRKRVIAMEKDVISLVQLHDIDTFLLVNPSTELTTPSNPSTPIDLVDPPTNSSYPTIDLSP